MIDNTTLIAIGFVAQAAAPARALLLGIRPHLRGPGMLASIALTPAPSIPPHHAGIAAIAAPATPHR
jgi:hypothetical protein